MFWLRRELDALRRERDVLRAAWIRIQLDGLSTEDAIYCGRLADRVLAEADKAREGRDG